MPLLIAGWGSPWTIIVLIFVVGNVLKWGSRGARWGYYRGRRWDPDHLLGRDSRLAEVTAALEARGAEVDQLHLRVTELENRLDFTERLLAQQHQSASVTGEAGGTPAAAR